MDEHEYTNSGQAMESGATGDRGASLGSGSPADRVAAGLALFCFALIVFLAKASDSTLPATDAATHADLAMNATQHGWIPKFPIGAESDGGHWGAGFNDHPFMYFYLSGWVMRFFGPDAWSAKLVPCLFSVGCVMLTLALGRALRSMMLGVIAGLMLALSRHFVIDGLNAHLDNVMIFFILASFVLWERGRFYLAGVAAGMGIWFKSPVAFLLFPTMAIVHLVRWEVRARFKPLLISFLIALAVGSLVWIVTGVLGGWDLVRDYWVRQLWGTAVGGRGGTQTFDAFAFLKVLRSHYMPWSVFLAVGLAWNIVFFRFRRKEFLVPVVAASIVIAVISLIRFKYDHYFIPAYPFLALLAAQPLAFWLERRESGFYRGFAVFTLVAATFILITPINPSPESFPALRKFAPYIQARGDCQDQIVMVEGEQPYGTFLDYKNLLHFYTGRRTAIADCQTVNLLAQKRDVKWILVFGKNYANCLDDSVRRGFPRVVQYGAHYLLGRPEMVDVEGGRLDLTPLGRELKAVTDCRAPALPRDRYQSWGSGAE